MIPFPFILVTIGCVLDKITTEIGLERGFYETHTQYSLFNSLFIWYAAMTILQYTLPKQGKVWNLARILLALVSFLGFFNNILVLAGVHQGWVI